MPLEKHLAYPRLRNTGLIHQILALSSWICYSFTFTHSLLSHETFSCTLYLDSSMFRVFRHFQSNKFAIGNHLRHILYLSIIKRECISENFRITRTYLIRMSAYLAIYRHYIYIYIYIQICVHISQILGQLLYFILSVSKHEICWTIY